jgi:hypothetical protein
LTLKTSYKELALLMLVVIMGMLIFSGLAYVGEKDVEGTMFDSMLTVSERRRKKINHLAAVAVLGHHHDDIRWLRRHLSRHMVWQVHRSGESTLSCFSSHQYQVCAICGVLCISLPIPIIVNNFNKFYEKSKIEEEIKAKKTKASWEDAKRGKVSLL